MPDLPSFTGDWLDIWGYDAVRYIQPKLKKCSSSRSCHLAPDLWLMLSQTVIVFDNLKDTLFLIHHADANQTDAYTQAQARLDQLEQLRLQSCQPTGQATYTTGILNPSQGKSEVP